MINNLTAHMLVFNEEKWIKLAILSVLPHVSSLLIFDTGSSDKTVEIVKSFNDEKIKFEEKGKSDCEKIISLRNEMIDKTKTDWFMVADGDEIYPSRIFQEVKEIIDEKNDKYFGIFLKNHVCVGDIFHELPEIYGKYEFCGKKGHLNLRFFKKMNGWKWQGNYPLEFYGDKNGDSINKMCDKLIFVNDYYYHMTFLKRSEIKSRNRIKYHLGKKITDKLPEVLRNNISQKRSKEYIVRSILETPFRYVKNKILSNS